MNKYLREAGLMDWVEFKKKMFCFRFILFSLSSNVPYSSPVGGGNAPISWIPAANQIQKKKKKKSPFMSVI